jgi:MFS family permease
MTPWWRCCVSQKPGLSAPRPDAVTIMTAPVAPAPIIDAPAQVAEPEASVGFLAVILLLMFAMNTLGRGVTETFAVFLLPVQKGLDVSRAEITATYSIYMLVFGVAAPIAGQLVDRIGVRVSYSLGLLSLGGGYYLAGLSTKLWHYYATVGVMGGIGSTFLGMVVASSIMARWFTGAAKAQVPGEKQPKGRLGTIVSLPYAAVGAGMLILPPATQLLLERMSWQSAHKFLGLMVLCLLPLLLLLPLARITAGSPSWQHTRRAALAAGTPTWTLPQALRTDAFWGLFVAYFVTSWASYSVLPQSVAYLIGQGFSPLFAASAFGMSGALSTVGIIGVASLSDVIGRRQAATLSYASTMLGILALLLTATFPSVLLVYGFVLFFGVMQGVRGPIILATIATLFRGGQVGTIFGTLMLAAGLGGAGGSLSSGLLHDWTGTDTASFLVAIAACCIGVGMFWLVPSIRNQRID